MVEHKQLGTGQHRKWPAIVTFTVERHQLTILRLSASIGKDRDRLDAMRCPSEAIPAPLARLSAMQGATPASYGSYRCRHCGYGNKPVYAGDRISDKKKKKRALRSIYNRCGGRDTDHPGVIIRPRNMKVFYFHRLRREAQARERDLYFDEDRQRWKYPPTRWFASAEKRSG